MKKADKLKAAQNCIDGMNELTIRFCPDGVDPDGKYIKKSGGYLTKLEVKHLKRLHNEIKAGLMEVEEDVEQEDGSIKKEKKKNFKNKKDAKKKLSNKFQDEADLDDILDLYSIVDDEPAIEPAPEKEKKAKKVK